MGRIDRNGWPDFKVDMGGTDCISLPIDPSAKTGKITLNCGSKSQNPCPCRGRKIDASGSLRN